MKIGDIAYIRNSNGEFWMGRVISRSEGYPENLKYTSPIVTVNGIYGRSSATIREANFTFCPDDGAYYEKKEQETD